jgi:hypothetical protein
VTEIERYDVVIIGDDLASAMAGALLADRGCTVRLLETPCPTWRNDGPLFGLFTAPTAKRIIEALDIGPTLRSRVDGPPEAITVALPDRRFLMPPSEPDRRQVLSAMFPDAADALSQLLEAIEVGGPQLDALLDGTVAFESDTFTGRRAWRRHQTQFAATAGGGAVSIPRHGPLRQLVDALLAFAGHTPARDQTLNAAAIRALWHVLHGVLPYRGGREGLRRLFVDRMRRAGGVITRAAPVEALAVGWRKARAAVLDDGTRVEARGFLVGAEPTLSRLLPDAALTDPATVQYMRVDAPPRERPDGLRGLCAWAPAGDGAACRLRVDDDGFEVRWRGDGEPPKVAALSPLGTMAPKAPTAGVDADSGRYDDYGLFRRPLAGPIGNLGVLGEWIVPGLGLESDCLTAWHGASFVARFRRRRAAAVAR